VVSIARRAKRVGGQSFSGLEETEMNIHYRDSLDIARDQILAAEHEAIEFYRTCGFVQAGKRIPMVVSSQKSRRDETS
jgi:hypothetical protein